MSETLPPITREGVVLQFVFPFDQSLPRTAGVYWRSTNPKVDTWYADVSQGGDATIVHEQVTFPGDAWAVYAKGSPDRLLAYHVATGEREQKVRVDGSAGKTTEQPRAAATTSTRAEQQEDADLAAAIQASMQTSCGGGSSSSSAGTGASAAAAAAAIVRRERQEILAAADPMAAAAALLPGLLRPTGEATAASPAAAPASAGTEASLARAVALSRELAAAHRSLDEQRRGWAAAMSAGEGAPQRVRLQLTLPDGSRSTHEARPDAPLRSVLALARWQLGERCGLQWCAEQRRRAGGGAQDTHAVVCTHPRLRLSFGLLCGGEATAAPGAELEAGLAAAGLAPSAALRVVALEV